MKYFVVAFASLASASWPNEATVTWIPGPHTGGYDPELTKAEARQKKQTLSFGVPSIHPESQVTAQKESVAWPEDPTSTWIPGPYTGDKDQQKAEDFQKKQHLRFGVPTINASSQMNSE